MRRKMIGAETLGFIAACCTTGSFIPQAWLVIRTRRTAGISLLMYSFFTIGVAFWLCYGLLTGALPIVMSNSITLILASTILTIAASERWKRRGTLKAREPGVVLKPFQNPDILYHQDLTPKAPHAS